MLIIPIFVPHAGCPHDCCFCDQKKISGHKAPPAKEEIIKTVETYLDIVSNYSVVQIAFFGGSFTGIPQELQRQYLEIAKKYTDAGMVDGIRLSTRPDYINGDIIENLLRHKVVPVLKSLNSSLEGTVTNMCEALKEDLLFLEDAADTVSFECVSDDGIKVNKLKTQQVSVVKRVLSAYFTKITGGFADSLHIERMLDSLLKESKSSLPKGFCCEVKNGIFSIKKEGQLPTKTYNTEILFKEFKKTYNVNNLLLKNIIDYDTIVGDLKVRKRLEGDAIKLKGRNCTKSLKKLFCELKIPTEDRDNIPVAADDRGVVWVYGVGVSERNAVTKNTKNVAEFKTNVSGEYKK